MHFPAWKSQNDGAVAHLVTFLMFGSFLATNMVFLCCAETNLKFLRCTETKGGGLRAGGRLQISNIASESQGIYDLGLRALNPQGDTTTWCSSPR